MRTSRRSRSGLAHEDAEVRPRQPLALAAGEVREALGEVDARDAPPLGDQPVQHRAERVADRRLRRKRKEVQQPHEGEDDAAHAGLAPAGVL
jgi:hypothetical protein